MRAVTVPEFGGPEVLEVRELPTPPPGPGEIRIRVAAATVNPADTLLRAGVLPLPLDEVPRPYIPGLELAGRVDAVGPDTGPRAPRPGDAVLAVTTPVRAGGVARPSSRACRSSGPPRFRRGSRPSRPRRSR